MQHWLGLQHSHIPSCQTVARAGLTPGLDYHNRGLVLSSKHIQCFSRTVGLLSTCVAGTAQVASTGKLLCLTWAYLNYDPYCLPGSQILCLQFWSSLFTDVVLADRTAYYVDQLFAPLSNEEFPFHLDVPALRAMLQ